MKNFIKKVSPKLALPLFYSKKESWWLLGFSMILSSGILIEPQIMCAALSKGKLSEMWIYWSGIIGAGFSIAFFAHLWQRVPLKTENEFIFFRFSGLGAKLLHGFRSLYVGGIIVPFIIAFSLLAYSKIICFIIGISQVEIILILTALLLIGSFFNSLTIRLRLDFMLFLLFIILFISFITIIYTKIGGISVLANEIKHYPTKIALFPNWGSVAFNGFIVFISVQWWSASILDYPDMNGQKLMITKSSKDVVKTILLPSLVLFVFRLFAFTLPFIVVVFGMHHGITDSELAFTNLFIQLLPKWMLVLVVVFFGIPFLSLVQNNQNWGGSLLVQNFYSYHINLTASEKNLKHIGVIAMIYIIVLAGVIALNFKSLMDMIKLLFAITAGVGPVFILRWYWWRINAWSQLSAMVSALIYPVCYDLAYRYLSLFTKSINAIQTTFNLEYYPVALLILTVLVCSTWLSVTFITKPTDKKVLDNFIAVVKPGGFWNGFVNNNKTQLGKRMLVWFLNASNGIVTILLFWNFVAANYSVFFLLLLLFFVLFGCSYIVLKKVNSDVTH